MKLTIFFIIFTCEIIAIIVFELMKLAREIYTYKKINKNFEELMKANQGGTKDN